MESTLAGPAEEPSGDVLEAATRLAAAGQTADGLRLILAAVAEMAPDRPLAGRSFTALRNTYALLLGRLVRERPFQDNQPERWREHLAAFIETTRHRGERDYRWLRTAMRGEKAYHPLFLREVFDIVAREDPPDPRALAYLLRWNMWAGVFPIFEQAAPLVLADIAERRRLGQPVDAEELCLVGEALLLTNRVDDAEHCFVAAEADEALQARAQLGRMGVAMDRGDLESAAAFAARAAERLRSLPGRGALAEAISRICDLWQSRRHGAPPASVEVVIFCHVSQKLVRNAALGAPGVGLIALAVDSLHAQFPDLAGVRTSVFYDHRDTELNRAYRESLSAFCAARGFELVVNQDNGLRRQWLHAFSRANSDAVMVVEQDHEFLPGCPAMGTVLNAFASRPDVNYIRISRQRLRNWAFDSLLSQTARDQESGLSRAWQFSNTPHVLRRDFYEAVVHPIISGNLSFDGRNLGAGGVEESINQLIRSAVDDVGHVALMRIFGFTAWGNIGDKALAIHTGV